MICIELNGIQLNFETLPTLFSPHALDEGTKAMLSCVEFHPDDKVLDLGCGYGFVGLYAAKQIGGQRVTMVDIDPSAVAVASENARLNGEMGIRVLQSDGFRGLDDAGYTLILSNPPYHTDFSVAKHFIEKGFNRLVIGGRMVMVTKRRDWYKTSSLRFSAGYPSRKSTAISSLPPKSAPRATPRRNSRPSASCDAPKAP